MKVKCIYNSTKSFFVKKFPYESYENYEKYLVIDKEYLVYGILYYKEEFCYLIFNEQGYPFWYLSKVFLVVDRKISKYWYVDFSEDQEIVFWGYFELVNHPYHNNDLMKENIDNLIEKEEEALEIFYKRKKEMDLEFADNSIEEKATIIKDKWLMCPKCIDAWESNSTFGMVECPKCKTIMHNPRYKKFECIQ
jgi:hypothetical protein